MENIALSTTASNSTTAPTILDLQTNNSLWYKIHVFIYDLRHFHEIPTSQTRLDQIADPSYLGLPYFTPTEVSQVKSTLVGTGAPTLAQLIEETLNERLEKRMKKRVESEDYRVCAAHDLAPIFEKALNINSKEHAKNKEFLALIEKSGLKFKDGEEWKGLPKKTFEKKKGKKR